MSSQRKLSRDELIDRLFNMVSVGVINDRINQSYDVISTSALLLNLAASIADTYESAHRAYGNIFDIVEAVTVAFFAIDYILRIITASRLYPEVSEKRAVFRYIRSFSGVIDLLSFLPYYLPVFFPGGVVAFRMIRVVRIMRLFRINAYYDSLNVITEVLNAKKMQLLSSVFIILVLMLASSLCMYSVEHEVQPQVFSNAFSGIWWSASTLLTVGYGDIYPITSLGKILGIIISFLGVGMVAIPTGIISAGFVEQYTRLKRFGDYAIEEDIHFIEVSIEENDRWADTCVRHLGLPKGVLIAVIFRGKTPIIPRGDTVLRAGDTLVMGAEPHKGSIPAHFREILLGRNNEWNGKAIRDLDISRKSIIVMIKRKDRTMVPWADLVLREGDTVYMYSESSMDDTNSLIF